MNLQRAQYEIFLRGYISVPEVENLDHELRIETLPIPTNKPL